MRASPDDYRANPIVLYSHDQTRPVGKCLWIKPEGNGLIAKTYYTPRPKSFQGEWLPDFVLSMVQADVLRGKSIGFLPLEVREPDAAELEQNPRLQYVITRSLLVEYSIVSVPSNPLALVEAVGKGVGLEHWGYKVIGKVKKKQPVLPRPRVYGPMAEKLADIKLDPEAIAEQAVRNLLDKWRA